MLLFLVLSIVITSSIISYLYISPNKFYINPNKIIIYVLWALVFLLTGMFCSNRAMLGLIFNLHAPDIDFMQTISSGYFGNIYLADAIYVLFGVLIYFFITRKLKISPPWILLGLAIITTLIYYPGIPSADGNGSYNQYLSHSYTDYQPPIFDLWWNIFHFQGAVFIVNLFLYYGGLIYISYILSLKGKKWQTDLLVVFSLNPLLFTQLAIVWRDISFTGLLIISAAIYLAIKTIKNQKLIFGLWGLYFLVLFLATGFRINGIFAALPLIFIGIYNLFSFVLNPRIQFLASVLLTIMLSSIFVGINYLITYDLYSAKRTYHENFPMISDMAYIECETNHDFKINPEFFSYKGDDARDILCSKVINYYNHDALYGNWNNTPVMFEDTNDDITAKRIKKEWEYGITHYPFAYLSYRTKFFLNDLFFPYWYPIEDSANNASWYNSDRNVSQVQALLYEVSMYQHKDMKFILPLFLVSATIACIFICLYFQIYGLAFIILLSTVFQLIGWLFLMPAHPARYFLWDYIAPILVICLLRIDNKNNYKVK